jgi:hypothetical protein
MRVSGAAVVLLPLVALAGCGKVHVAQTHAPSCESGGFAASLAKDTGGQPSALAAAEWQAQRGVGDRFPLPATGWHVERQGLSDAEVRSGDVQLHAITGRDGTWFVDSGKCAGAG